MSTPKRIAIVGTAPSVTMTPWDDPGLTIASLNDAYRIRAFKRADLWYDLHPMDHYYHPENGEQPVFAHQVPPGHYARPKDHLAWLGRQTIPIYLHPAYQTQHPPAAGWPHARAFPKAAVEDFFGTYFTSSPAWMLAQAVMDGVTDFVITGIHLSTDHEHREQRNNFEFLCGRILGPGRIRVTRADGWRYYETAYGRIQIPEMSPVLSSNFQYAFQPRPASVLPQFQWDVHRYTIKRERVIGRLAALKPWHVRQMRALQAELEDHEACLQDAKERLGRAQQEAQSHG